MSKPKIDEKLFWVRTRQVWKSLSKGRETATSNLNNVDAMLVWADKHPEEDVVDAEYAECACMSLHALNGYEFPETMFAFTQTSVIIVASEKKIKMVEHCKDKDPGEAGTKLKLELLTRPKEQSGWDDVCAKVAGFVKKSYKGSQVAACIHKRDIPGFGDMIVKALKAEGLTLMSNGNSAAVLEESLAYKDNNALLAMKEASKKVSSVAEKFRKEMIPALDDKPMTHEAMLAKLDKMLVDEDKELESAGITAVQSGTTANDFVFQLKGWKSPAPRRNVSLDVITLRAGASARSYHSFLARTIFIDPTPAQKDAYALAMNMREAAIEALKPGAKASQVFSAAKRVFDAQSTVSAESFTADRVGFGIGLGFCETDPLALGNDRTLLSGTTYAIEIRLENMHVDPSKEGDERVFSIWLGDVVVVSGAPSGSDVLTEGSHVEWKKNHFRIMDAEDNAEDEKPSKAAQHQDAVGGPRRTTRQQARELDGRGQEPTKSSLEEEMARRQGDRLMRKREEALANGSKLDGDYGLVDLDEESRRGKMVSVYPSYENFKSDWSRDHIYVDEAKKCVLMPIGDRLVPFHISTIKTVTAFKEPDASVLRFNLHFPSGGAMKDVPAEMLAAIEMYPQLAYIKELTFRCRDDNLVNTLSNRIKTMQKAIKENQKKELEERGIVKQAALKLLHDRPKETPATLNDVSMLPTPAGKTGRCIGRLRAHVNGFQFKGERVPDVDILYSNIKYFFFSRGEREIKVLVHFYLRNPIMIGKKKTKHVQFFTEVQEGGVDLGARGSRYDRDELDDEDRQRRLVTRLNKMFAQFCKESLTIAKANGETIGDDNEIEVVNTEDRRKAGFYGTPYKEMVLIQPTDHCLVNLTDKDFFVIGADEIEHIHFERVAIGKSKNFDIVFVLKSQMALDGSGDNIKVVTIDLVKMDDMDKVRKWIDEHDPITYTMGIAKGNWDEFMRTVRYELQEGIFWADEVVDEVTGEREKKPIGWMFLNPADDDEGEENEDEDEDEEYESSDEDEDGEEGSDEDDEDDDDSDDDLGSVVDEDDDDDDDFDDDEDEEEGEDWDELERKAEKEDRERKRKDTEIEEKDRKKAKMSK